MRCIIIEDEGLNAMRIKDLLGKLSPEMQVLAVLDSVRSSVEWLSSGQEVDLIFMDIQLGDGLAFDIFDQVEVRSPVVFTTAFQEYTLRAFKVHSVDYLLKPVNEQDLSNALAKYERHYQEDTHPEPTLDPKLLGSIRKMLGQHFKTRFMVRVGEHLRSVVVKDILYFYSMDKGTFLHNVQGRSYVIDPTLDALGDMLDPAGFFRINRKYMVSMPAIEDLVYLSSTKLKVRLKGCQDDAIYVSRDRIPAFKAWLDR